MNDDLGTPGAVAALFDAIRHGNQAITASDGHQVRIHLLTVSHMLDVLGLNPGAPEWVGAVRSDDLTPVVDGLVAHLLEQRTAARAAKDWAAADAIRDTLAALGLTIEDTPSGPRWNLEKN